MPTAAIIGGGMALGQIGSSVIGSISSASDREAARQAMQQAYQEIEKVGAPPNMAKAIFLKHFQQAGILTPQLENAVNVNFSNVANLQEDPTSRNAQMSALRMLQQQSQTGLNAQDRAAFDKLRNDAASQAEGKRQQILQSFAQRGQFGSGAEMAAQLQASSNDLNSAAQRGDDLAANSSQAALSALGASGQLAGQVRSTDFDIANTKARAADQIRQFNTQNAIAMQQRNADRQNGAQQFNLENAQNLSNQNVAMDNNEQMRQTAAQRQYWQDLLNYGGAKAAALQGQSGYYQGQADRTAGNWQKIGAGVGGAIGSAYKWSQQGNTGGGNASTQQPASQYGPNYDRLDLMGQGDEMKANNSDPWSTV